jgi:hypothetical protein
MIAVDADCVPEWVKEAHAAFEDAADDEVSDRDSLPRADNPAGERS